MKRITLAHGGGGLEMRRLVEEEILPRFGEGPLRDLPDAAILPPLSGAPVVSTDGFVVQPLEFPGGNIGHLAVHGTVNDVAVGGGRPRWLTLGMVLEEGLPFDVLGRVLDAVAGAARACGVKVVAGDTKVVPRGACDGMALTTTGIGEAIPGLALGPRRCRPGDRVLVSGSIGDHGAAVLCAREGFERGPDSDTAPVHRLVAAGAALGAAVRFLRDPTRGGVATVLHELAEAGGVGVRIDESAVPVAAATRAVADILGLDLLQVACEGRVVAVCAAEAADALLGSWRSLPEGRGAAVVGEITDTAGRVVLETALGGRRVLLPPAGELLPRIC